MLMAYHIVDQHLVTGLPGTLRDSLTRATLNKAIFYNGSLVLQIHVSMEMTSFILRGLWLKNQKTKVLEKPS